MDARMSPKKKSHRQRFVIIEQLLQHVGKSKYTGRHANAHGAGEGAVEMVEPFAEVAGGK